MATDLNKLTTLEQLKAGLTAAKNYTDTQDALLGGRIDDIVDRIDNLDFEGGAQANLLEGVKVNGTALAIAEKMVDILIATGDTNGSIKVNGVDVAVKGLEALAFKAQVSESDLDEALTAVIAAKATQSDLEALGARVTDAEGLLTTLTGGADVDGSVANQIAEAVASIMENPDETLNSIKELVDWTTEHAADALELSNQVTENKNDIAALETLIGTLPEGATSTTIVAYIAEAIAAIPLGDYAKPSDVSTAISTALANYYTKEEVDAKVKAVDDKFAGYTNTEGMNAAIKEVDDKFADYTKTEDIDATYATDAQAKEYAAEEIAKVLATDAEVETMIEEVFPASAEN